MSTSTKTFLANVEPFNRLPALELENLSMMAHEVQHAKGETVYSEGDEAHSIFILKTGRLEIFKYSTGDKPAAIESITPKGIYGMYCRIGNTQCAYPCTAIAAVESTSIQIPDKIFWNLFERYPTFVTGVCTLCSKRLSDMQDLVRTSQESVQKRIVRTLVNFSKENGPVIPMTKREIAELSATSVETTIRTLSAFEKKRWISSERGQITLKEKQRLEALIA